MTRRDKSPVAVADDDRADIENADGDFDDTSNLDQAALNGAMMTRGDRNELAKIVKSNVRVAKMSVERVEAERLADVEAQLSARYSSHDQAWAEVTQAAKDAVAEADEKVAQICRERGISDEFRPTAHFSWWDRGENAEQKRRAELRKVAQTRIAADGLAAKYEIEARGAEALTRLYVAGLTTDAAQEFLSSIPSAESLMPSVRLAEIEGSQVSS